MENLAIKEATTLSPPVPAQAKEEKEKVTADKSAIPLVERTDLTYAEVEALGVTDPYELIEGRFVFKMANPKQAYFEAKITSELGNYLRQHAIGALFSDLNLNLFPDDGHQLRLPDLALYSNEHLPASDEPHTVAPDLAVEIISSNSLFLDVLDKADLYLSKGSKLVWIVIPDKACVLVWTATERRWEYETLACPELLPDWSLDLAKFFTWPKPVKSSP